MKKHCTTIAMQPSHNELEWSPHRDTNLGKEGLVAMESSGMTWGSFSEAPSRHGPSQNLESMSLYKQQALQQPSMDHHGEHLTMRCVSVDSTDLSSRPRHLRCPEMSPTSMIRKVSLETKSDFTQFLKSNSESSISLADSASSSSSSSSRQKRRRNTSSFSFSTAENDLSHSTPKAKRRRLHERKLAFDASDFQQILCQIDFSGGL